MDWHPLLVHYPIVLLPLSVGVDLLARLRGRPDWHHLAYGLLVLGALAALVAVLTGDRAAAPYRQQAGLEGVIERHEDWATASLLLSLFIVLGRLPLHLRGHLQGRPLLLWVGAAALGSALVWMTGYYGGVLVYEHGVGVRRGGTHMVEIEEVVATYEYPNNGAGPLWCYGAPLVVRQGEEVFVSAMETGAGVAPLCNTRWRLLRRERAGWEQVGAGADFDEREPCPLVRAGGPLLLSTNPLIDQSAERKGPCRPLLLAFEGGEPRFEEPPFSGAPRFTEHSYRGLAADAARGEVLLLHIDAHSGAQHWSWRDGQGTWRRQGHIEFPIRSCYPQVALRQGAGHVLAIGDIVEPVEDWRVYKREQTGRAWDYVFRRLFYAWTPDIGGRDFGPPLEVENVEQTAGYLLNLDLWIDAEGRAHILYLKRNVASELMRDRFFPGEKLEVSLEYAVLAEGKVEERKTLMRRTEEEGGLAPGYGRLHAGEGERLYAVVYASEGERADNYLLEVKSGQLRPLGMQAPLRLFFTACERGGSAPGPVVDLFGVGAEAQILRYARVRI